LGSSLATVIVIRLRAGKPDKERFVSR